MARTLAAIPKAVSKAKPKAVSKTRGWLDSIKEDKDVADLIDAYLDEDLDLEALEPKPKSKRTVKSVKSAIDWFCLKCFRDKKDCVCG